MKDVSIRSLFQRAPVSFLFCVIALLTLVSSFALPASLMYVALFPEYVTGKGYLWSFLTYAAMPANLPNFVGISALLLWFGWYLEPLLSRVRYIVLIVSATVVSGIAYFFFQPAPAPPLIGGLFVVSAAGIAFSLWLLVNRTRLSSGQKVFLILVVCWVAYVLWASPLYLSGVHITAWLIGLAVAFGPIWHSRPPNKALQATCEDARA